VDWVVTGSTARALLGSGERPRDLDIEVRGTDAERAAAVLGLILARDVSNGLVSDRALGIVGRVKVDMSANVAKAGEAPDERAFFDSARVVRVGGRAVRAASRKRPTSG
jgi:hypothetical protein